MARRPSAYSLCAMTLLIENSIRDRAHISASAKGTTINHALIAQAQAERSAYDIFLSQTMRDEELVFGIYSILTEDLGLHVFCDWIESPSSDRSDVTPEDAAYIRAKMVASDALILIDSDKAVQSSWMCWEIGWFDGAKGKISILPIVSSARDVYRGRQFLGLYPIIEDDDRHTLRVSIPLSRIAKRFPPGTPIGMATWMPLEIWCRTPGLPSPFVS